ncbi:MAG: hypothetical protein ACYTDT_13720, partial [Planctomycetota bacterium]
MRNTALLSLALILVIAVLGTVEKRETKAQEQPAPADSRSSLENGQHFDLSAQLEFEDSLTPDERAALIRLKSRYVIADPDSPLPTSEPRQPFILRLRDPMSRSFADSLAASGVSFVGYVGPNGHILRCRDLASIEAVRAVINKTENVLGTVLVLPRDRRDYSTDTFIISGLSETATYDVRFWGDVSKLEALTALIEAGIETVESGYEDNPWIRVSMNRPELVALSNNVDVEWIGKFYADQAHNVDSSALVNATQGQIGPSTSYNLNGDGIVVGIWDGGTVRSTHDAFQSANDSTVLNSGNA